MDRARTGGLSSALRTLGLCSLVCLVATVVAGYLTRLQLVAAATWVTHTDEVKLAIARCEIRLARHDRPGLRAAIADVGRLTVDNPEQQANVARAVELTDAGDASTPDLEALLDAMRADEDRLMTTRLQRIDVARLRSATAFVAGAVLAALSGIGAASLFLSQRRSLVRAYEATGRARATLEAVIETIDDGVLACDASRAIIAMNAAARRMVGPSFPRDRFPEDWTGHLVAVFEDGSPMPPREGALARALRGEAVDDLVYRTVRTGEDGPGTWISATARPIRDGRGEVVAGVATLRDVTEDRADAARLRDLSSTDEMTGLLNRRGFLAAAGARFEASRQAKAPLALLYADVNGLKLINDGLGHEQGDCVIRDAARALRSAFRDHDIVARLGGDEFVALLPNLPAEAGNALLERIAAGVRSHAADAARPYRLSLSTGITFADWDADTSLEQLLKRADGAMYERKRARHVTSEPVIKPVR